MSFAEFPAAQKDLEGVLRDLSLRIDEQARRQTAERISAGGQYITDYDLATEAGFYWSDVSTNGPAQAGTLTVCLVMRSDTRLIQELWSLTVTDAVRVNSWRRMRSGTWRSWTSVGAGLNQGATAITASVPPSGFEYGYNYAQGDATFPTANVIVETVRYADVRAVQRCWAKGDDAAQRWWYRQAIDASTWGIWTLGGSDTGWQSLTLAAGWSGVSPQYRVRNGRCEFRGEVYGGTDITTVFTMPAGARPISRLSHLAPRIVTTGVPPVLSLNMQTTGVTTAIAYSGAIPSGSPGYALGGLSYSVD